MTGIMEIREVTDTDEKQRITRFVLESLPDWFGIAESREQYVRDSTECYFVAAYDGEQPVGFLCLKETGRATVELHVMGVLQEYHRKGIGRDLLGKAKKAAVRQGYSFLQVKTVRMGVYNDYDDTNRFYLSLGFMEFEVFPMLWDEQNPCQVYVMYLGGDADNTAE